MVPSAQIQKKNGDCLVDVEKTSHGLRPKEIK